jgi:hypothetical protein
VRRFGAMTGDLLELSQWLQQLGVTHVAMESTGVYWKPVWNRESLLVGFSTTNFSRAWEPTLLWNHYTNNQAVQEGLPPSASTPTTA